MDGFKVSLKMEPTTREILICVVISFFIAVSSNRKFHKNIWISLVFIRALDLFALFDETKLLLRNVSCSDVSDTNKLVASPLSS